MTLGLGWACVQKNLVCSRGLETPHRSVGASAQQNLVCRGGVGTTLGLGWASVRKNPVCGQLADVAPGAEWPLRAAGAAREV